MATITLPTLALVSAISAIASSTDGIDIRPSMTRITTASSQRTKPVTRPIASPSKRRQHRDREADDQRDARAVDDAAVDVAAEHVGAEPELRRRRLAGA